jgi:hypothetical protein
MDYPSRLLHGSLTRSINALVRSDYDVIARNTTKVSQSVQDLFDTSVDPNMLYVARYASLVTSIANKIGSVRPQWRPAPAVADDQGLVNVLSYVTQWATQQLDRKQLGTAASACIHWLDASLNIDWSANFKWYDHHIHYCYHSLPSSRFFVVSNESIGVMKGILPVGMLTVSRILPHKYINTVIV